MRKFTNQAQALANFLPVLVLDHHRQLSIPAAQQRTVINVGRPNQSDSIVNDQQLAVDVDDLSDRPVIQFGMGSQTEEKEIIVQIGHLLQLAVHVVYVLEMEVHLNTKYCCLLVSRMALKSGKSGKKDDHSKFFLLFVCLKNFIDDALGDSILLRNEKLVLDINELPCVIDEVVICVENRCFCLALLEPDRPHRLASHYLVRLGILPACSYWAVWGLVECDVLEGGPVTVVYYIFGVEFIEKLL